MLHRITGSSCQIIYLEYFYKRILRRTLRKTLFKVIQDSVDAEYYLEEISIGIAKSLLD